MIVISWPTQPSALKMVGFYGERSVKRCVPLAAARRIARAGALIRLHVSLSASHMSRGDAEDPQSRMVPSVIAGPGGCLFFIGVHSITSSEKDNTALV